MVDNVFEKLPFNIEKKRRKYIPYNCRCEAIGDCRDNGRRYRSLEGKWTSLNNGDSFTYQRGFMLTKEWSGRRIYLNLENCAERNAVYINGTLVCAFEGSKVGEPCHAETEITSYVDFEGENMIEIVCKGNNAEKRCFAYIFARKFVHIRDFNITFSNSSIYADVFVSRNVPADITLEAYNDELELLESVTEKINGEGKIILRNVGDEENIRIVLLVCGDEVIPYTISGKDRPIMPKGISAILNEKKVVSKDFIVYAIDIQNKKFLVEYVGKNVLTDEKLKYSVTTEIGEHCSGEFVAMFSDMDGKYCAEVELNYSVPSLSFYEFFLNVEKDDVLVAQFKLPVRQTACEKIYSADMKPFTVCKISDDMVGVRGINFDTSFDLLKGQLVLLSKEGCDVISGRTFFESEQFVVKYEKSRIINNDDRYVAISSTYSIFDKDIENMANALGISIMWILFGDGEVSVSISGFGLGDVSPDAVRFCVPVADACDKVKVHGAFNDKVSVYDMSDGSNNADTFIYRGVRWVYSYGDRVAGLLVKVLQPTDMKIKSAVQTESYIDDIIAIPFIPDENGMLAFSIVFKAVFYDNEDIVREARTIPGII